MKLFPFKVLFRSCLLKPSVWDSLTWSALKDGVSPGGKDTNKSVVQTFFFFYKLFMYLYFIFGCAGCASLRGAFADCCSGGFTLVAVRRLLFALASLVAEQRIEGTRAQ